MATVSRGYDPNRALKYVKYFASQGADVNVRDGSGRTPLYLAASIDHLEIVKFLVSKGANVNAKDNDGQTPLFRATGSIEVVKFLVSNGADVNVKPNNGSQTTLDLAAGLGRLAVVEYLKSVGAQSDRRDAPISPSGGHDTPMFSPLPPGSNPR